MVVKDFIQHLTDSKQGILPKDRTKENIALNLIGID